MKHFSLILFLPLLLILIGWDETVLTIDVDSEEAQYLEEKEELLYYKKDLFTGELVKYFENGELNFRKEYKEGEPHGVWVTYYKNGQKKIKGLYEAGKKRGVWKEYFKDGRLLVSFNYNDPTASIMGNEEGAVKDKPVDLPPPSMQAEENTKLPYRVVNEMPAPPGGMKAFYIYIYENIRYPARARKKKIQGIVYVQFVVQPDGRLSNFQVLRGPGGGLNEEAVRVIKSYPKKWKPGMQDGEPVPVYFNLPLKFSMQ